MAAQHTVTVEVALAPEQAEAAVYQAFVQVGLEGVAGGGGVMRGASPMSWSSWGENVSATIGHGPRGAVVQLHSASTVPALVDWGRNRKNVERVLEVFRALAPVV